MSVGTKSKKQNKKRGSRKGAQQESPLDSHDFQEEFDFETYSEESENQN